MLRRLYLRLRLRLAKWAYRKALFEPHLYPSERIELLTYWMGVITTCEEGLRHE